MLVYFPPILILSTGWFLNDPVALLASAVFCIWIFGYQTFSLKHEIRLNLPVVFTGGIFISLLVSAITNNVSQVVAWQGMYQRNFGLFFWFNIFCLILLLNSNLNLEKKYITKSLEILLWISITYGFLQFLELDPFPWQNNLKAVQLTLGNPNFAGALYGLLVLIPYSKLILNKSKKFLFLQYFLLATLVFLSIQTKSLQSFLVLFVCIATYTLLVSKVISEKRRRRIVISLTITSFILVILIGISFFLNSSILKEIISRIIFEGNVTQRLSYWQTALQVFLRNPWFGVGPDQLQLYAAEVRSSKDVLRDGTYTLTDRAHNVFLDQLANGGIFAGLFWLGFVLLVFRLIIKLYRMELESNSLNSLALLASIWIGYLTQGFLSPDHGLLAILGFFSAGLILSIARRENVGYKDFVFAGKMTLIVRIFSAMMMIICLIFWGKALQSDYMTRQVLRGEITDKIETYQVLDSWTNPRAAELIGIYRARNNLDCDIVAKAANKMLEVSERYAQAWYFRGYCDNLKGNPKGAIKNVEKAIEYDPLNPDYILSLVKLNLFMNDKPGAIKWYQILHRNYPENPELKTLLQSIENIT